MLPESSKKFQKKVPKKCRSSTFFDAVKSAKKVPKWQKIKKSAKKVLKTVKNAKNYENQKKITKKVLTRF